MRLLGRWLADSLGLALSLVLALLLMQAPALTHEYAVALLQRLQEAGRDIDQRMAAARQFYSLPDAPDADVLTTLAAREPSNAQSLSRSLDRARALRTAHDRLEAASPLMQPLIMAYDALRALIPDTDVTAGDTTDVLRTTLRTYVPQLAFSAAAAIYALLGLLLGGLLAEVVVSLLRRLGRRSDLDSRATRRL